MSKISVYLVPPFSRATGIQPSTRASLPHSAHCEDYRLLEPKRSVYTYLETDLQTPRLNAVHGKLWLAGLPRPARPLHRQRRLLRHIQITEYPDEHLVWHDAYICIKPLPEYLFDYEFWEEELCKTEALHKSAYGLLLSYAWLVCRQSDFRIAVEMGFLTSTITYDYWNGFMIDFKNHIDTNNVRQFDKRYEYGKLRLSRLNTFYRFGLAGLSARNIMNGFMPVSTRYKSFFENNFSWILGAFLYLTVLLSAMQVALATERFANDLVFHQFSASVGIMSISFVLAAAATLAIVWLLLVMFHVFSTMKYCKKVAIGRNEGEFRNA